MKKLVIITGASGTGKSTLAKELYRKLENSTLLSLDILSENMYDNLGFKNKEQKNSLRLLNRKIYKELIKEAIKRNDEIIILEYPFKKNWLIFFKNLVAKYNYEIYTINMFAKDFEIIWQRLLERENSKERHPSHYLNSYNLRKKEEYIPYFEYKYETLKKEYDNLISNSINLGKIINVEDIENLDINSLLQKIIK